MGEKQTPTDAKYISTQMKEAHERLRQLDIAERRYWIAISTVTVVLAMGIFVLTYLSISSHVVVGSTLALAIRLITIAVVCYSVFALRQHQSFAARTREAASEIAVITASETLRMANGRPGPEVERRGSARIGCNQRLVVRTHDSEGLQVYYGRILDICEHGLGAIVPGLMEAGQEVLLEFSLVDSLRTPSQAIKVSAIVRQRSGFRYGFNFVAISETDREQIESYRGTDRVVSIVGRGAAAADPTI